MKWWIDRRWLLSEQVAYDDSPLEPERSVEWIIFSDCINHKEVIVLLLLYFDFFVYVDEAVARRRQRLMTFTIMPLQTLLQWSEQKTSKQILIPTIQALENPWFGQMLLMAFGW